MTTTNITGNAGALQGRVALVVGASRGIGAATARAMAGAGAAVVLAARDATRLEDVAASIRADGGTATGAVLPVDGGLLAGMQGFGGARS